MKYSLLLFFLFCSSAIIAQPVWSPEVRAERENKWMHDSLKLSPEKLHKAYDISLSYYRDLDKYEKNQKMQDKVMHRKDVAMKPMLTRQQYQMYYRREKELRQALRVKYPGRHQPY